MFKKLISSLPFSPALVGQLAFYAKRLKKEEATRKMGLVFLVLALIVQSFSVFQPPESANAASSNDLIYGGFSSKDDFLSSYDNNTGSLKDLLSTIGINRNDIQAANNGKWNSHTDGGYSWGRLSRFSYAQGERAYTVPTSDGGSATFYYRPLNLSDTLAYTKQNGSTYDALVGTTGSGTEFAILNMCGNLVLKVAPPPVRCPNGQAGTYPNCASPPKMCTIKDRTDLLANDPNCKIDPVAACQSLTIDKIANNYQFTTTALAANGMVINGYVYTIQKNGRTVAEQTISTSQSSNIYVYNQSSEGNYSVRVAVNGSAGSLTSDDCAKTFHIAPPEKCPQNPQILKINPECQPCPGESLLWIKDESCAANLVQTKTATNITQNNTPAQDVTAKANDRIIYRLTVENKGTSPADFTFIERVDDITEYANIIDSGGGTQGTDTDTKTTVLTWPKITIQPGEKITRMFTVQIMSTIPALAKGVSEPTSYDCRMSNTFGNNVTIAVDCPVQKQIIETIVTELPRTGATTNVIVAALALALVTYLYTRSRQLKTEVRLIRRDFNTGTI